MNPLARYPRRTAAAALGALLLAAACTDRSPVTPEPQPGETPANPPGRPVHLVAVSCTVDVAAGTSRCDDAPNPGTAATDLILGGQNRYVNLDLGAVHYDVNTQSYQMEVRVRNLIPQSLGTTDGTTLDPNGVRVFLQAGPNVKTGTGNVTLASDGVGTFTASNQQYFQYNQVLDQFETSSARTWQFTMPATVTAFSFTAYVSAAVQFPDGWVEVTAVPLSMSPHAELKLSATARDAAGNFAEGGQFFTWASTDTTVATVTNGLTAGGLVSTLRAGTTTIQVSASAAGVSRVGAAPVTVRGMQRIWQGDVSSDYHTRGNWERDIVPVALDSIVIPNPSPNYPQLAQNAAVAGVDVADGALVNLGAFDMTASRNVAAGLSGGIVSTTGSLFLAGTAATVRGRMPRLRVTGTYSLSGNVTAVAPLRVDLGRLTNSTFRIQVSP
jgi:hypothetical protein